MRHWTDIENRKSAFFKKADPEAARNGGLERKLASDFENRISKR